MFSKAILDYVNGPSSIWLRIETYAYYSYVGACIFYILWIQCIGFVKNALISDLNKQILDFIDYAEINLTWFGFNFIKIFVPIYLLFLIDETASPMIESRVKSGNISYKWLMYGCLVINVFQFLVTSRIYVSDYKEQKKTPDPFEIDEPEVKAKTRQAVDDIFDHYKEIDREFIHMPIWLQILKGLVFSSLTVCYFVFMGPEMTFAIYLPVDLLLEFALFAFRLVEL